MTREQIICDECKAVKGEANHWHRIAWWPQTGTLALGMMALALANGYESHDLCGERCLMLHINRLLKLNGTGPLPTRDEQRELEKQSA